MRLIRCLLHCIWLLQKQIHTKMMFSFTTVCMGSYGLLIDQSQFTNFTCDIIILISVGLIFHVTVRTLCTCTCR